MKKLEKKCEPCPECDGSGLLGIVDISTEKTDYFPCEFCGGYQCFIPNSIGYEIYTGKCDESCGHNRESLKKNWPHI